MAEQKLIQGTFHGSVGTLTGAKWKDKEVVKQKIWSKTPASPAQKSSVRSFECLNRLSSAIAKAWWYKLGLSNAKMHKHNAVAKLLAPVVANHTFDPSAIEEVFKADGTGKIDSYTFDAETNLLEFSASTTLDVSAASGNSWLVVAFSVTGEVFLCESPAAATITRSLFVPVPADTEPYVLVLTTQKDRKRVRYGGFALKPSIATVDITFSLATDAITRTAANDTVFLTLSEAMPAGSYEVEITTHAIRQARYADTTLDATLVTDGTTAATLVFAPATDTLNQKDIFTLDSYVALEKGSATFGTEIIKWKRTEFAAKTTGGVSYTLANDITITANENGYTYDWGFPLPADVGFSVANASLNTVTNALAADNADNFTASWEYNADRTAAKETWQNPVIWATNQTAGTSGASVQKSAILVNIDFWYEAPNDPVFPPMSREIAFDYAAGAHHWATQGGPVMRSDTWTVSPTGNFTTGSTKVVNATGSAAGSSGSCAFSTLGGIASAGAVFLTFEFVPSGGFAPYASGTITVTDETYIEFTLATPIGGIEKFRINIATGAHTFTTS